VRAVVALPSAAQLISLVCRPVVRSGAAHPQALLALVDLLRYVRECGVVDDATLRDEVDYLLRAAERGLDDADDLDAVRAAAAQVA
jgi:uncharacterized membrane protein